MGQTNGRQTDALRLPLRRSQRTWVTGGRVPQKFGVGTLMQIVPPDFVMFLSKFHAPDYFHYNAVMQ